jgi:hypothetical protein
MGILSVIDSAAYLKAERALERGRLRQAFEGFEKLAARGHTGAQYRLGKMHMAGEGAPQDYEAALHWFRRAAEGGLPAAFTAVGCFFMEGLGPVAEDPANAARWFRVGAEGGDANAQFALGGLCLWGQGVPVDPLQAFMWLNVAASTGHEKAGEFRDELSSQLSPTDVARAQADSTNWVRGFRQAQQRGVVTARLSAAVQEVRAASLPAENKLVLGVGADSLVLTPEYVEYRGTRLPNESICHVAFGSIRVYTNGIPTQRETSIRLVGASKTIYVDFATLFAREDTIHSGFGEALHYLSRSVIRPLVDRFAKVLAEGKYVEIGGLVLGLGGVARSGRYKKGSGDSSVGMKRFFGADDAALARLESGSLRWQDITELAHEDGEVRLMVGAKLCWASLNCRTVLDAVCIEPLLRHPTVAAHAGRRF